MPRAGGCTVTEAKLTGGFRLAASYAIHTVGPHYGVQNDAALLVKTYWNVLDLAAAHDICSIAFPAISTGRFSYPKQAAAEIAVWSVRQWKREPPEKPMEVRFADVDLTIYRYFCKVLQSRDIFRFSGDDGEGMDGRMSYPPGGCSQGKLAGDAVQTGP